MARNDDGFHIFEGLFWISAAAFHNFSKPTCLLLVLFFFLCPFGPIIIWACFQAKASISFVFAGFAMCALWVYALLWLIGSVIENKKEANDKEWVSRRAGELFPRYHKEIQSWPSPCKYVLLETVIKEHLGLSIYDRDIEMRWREHISKSLATYQAESELKNGKQIDTGRSCIDWIRLNHDAWVIYRANVTIGYYNDVVSYWVPALDDILIDSHLRKVYDSCGLHRLCQILKVFGNGKFDEAVEQSMSMHAWKIAVDHAEFEFNKVADRKDLSLHIANPTIKKEYRTNRRRTRVVYVDRQESEITCPYCNTTQSSYRGFCSNCKTPFCYTQCK